MANNPYSPPVADVTEPPQAKVPAGPRPPIVTVGLVILALLVSYGVINFLLGPRLQQFKQGLVNVLAFVPLAFLLLQAAVIVFAFRRKNWARITLLALLALTIFALVMSVYALFKTAPAKISSRFFSGQSLSWSLLVLRAVGVILLFTPAANAWFRRGRD